MFVNLENLPYQMHHTSFEYVPREDVPSFVSQQQEPLLNRTPPEPAPIRTPDEIMATASVQETTPPRHTTVEQGAPKRIYVQTTPTQRQVLAIEYTKHGEAKPLSYYQERTRISYPTLRRLVKKLEGGEDITKRGKEEERRSSRPNGSKQLRRSCTRKTGLCARPKRPLAKQTSRRLSREETNSPKSPSQRSTAMSETKTQ